MKEMIGEIETVLVETIQNKVKRGKKELKLLTEPLWPVGDSTCNWKLKREGGEEIFQQATVKIFPNLIKIRNL